MNHRKFGFDLSSWGCIPINSESCSAKSAAEYLKDLSMGKVWTFNNYAISDHMVQNQPHLPVHDATAFPLAYCRMMLYDWRRAGAIFIFNARPIDLDPRSCRKLHVEIWVVAAVLLSVLSLPHREISGVFLHRSPYAMAVKKTKMFVQHTRDYVSATEREALLSLYRTAGKPPLIYPVHVWSFTFREI